MASAVLDFFPASFAEALGAHLLPSKFARVRLDAASSAHAKVAAAVAAGSSVMLTADEADAQAAMLALRATALRHGGRLPLCRVDAIAAKVSPFDGTGAIGLDPCGPILGRVDAQSVAAILACTGAIRQARAGATFGAAAPELPPVPVDPPGSSGDAKAAYRAGYLRGQSDRASGSPPMPPVGTVPPALQDSYALGYAQGYASVPMGGDPVVVTPGEKLGVAPAVIGGAIVAGVVLVGAAGYLIGSYKEEANGRAVQWQAEQAIAIRRAEIAADLALERWRMEVDTGKKLDPSPLEVGAASDVAELAKQETGSRWLGLGLGAGLGALAAGAVWYASEQL